jgi:cytochrome P450
VSPTRDTELGGVPITAGSTVTPMPGAANRREDRYPDPDAFDLSRPPTSLPVLFDPH